MFVHFIPHQKAPVEAVELQSSTGFVLGDHTVLEARERLKIVRVDWTRLTMQMNSDCNGKKNIVKYTPIDKCYHINSG